MNKRTDNSTFQTGNKKEAQGDGQNGKQKKQQQ